mmetsp:Transcript_45346/g.120250  ORF Transcript_45346/g.120250 Transcript_45346/m.120250 type:complete len:278 (-) Transcript_45346:200-1033(-)
MDGIDTLCALFDDEMMDGQPDANDVHDAVGALKGSLDHAKVPEQIVEDSFWAEDDIFGKSPKPLEFSQGAPLKRARKDIASPMMSVPDLPDAVSPLPPDVSPSAVILTATFYLRCELDMKTLAFKLRHAEYNPRKNSSISVRLFNPRVHALLHGSGAVSVVGSTTIDDLKLSAKRVARLVQRCGYPDAKFDCYRLTSLMAKADLHFPVRLDALAMKWRKNAVYEPEMYCGCVFRVKDPLCTLLVTAGGKVMVTGLTSLEDVTEALRKTHSIFAEFST